MSPHSHAAERQPVVPWAEIGCGKYWTGLLQESWQYNRLNERKSILLTFDFLLNFTWLSLSSK